MSLGWIKDFTKYDVNCLLLLEKKQISWIDETYANEIWAKVFQTNPHIAWYFINKCPSKASWVNSMLNYKSNIDKEIADKTVLKFIEDWLVFVTNPSLYDNLTFVTWDEKELTSLIDFNTKRIIDIGSGTGKQAFAVANNTNKVYCVEPVGNLRDYLIEKASNKGLKDFYVVDGVMTKIPFEDEFSDITMSGHVFGDNLEEEYQEMFRVTKPGGMIILIPGNIDEDNEVHHFLINKGFKYDHFLEPTDGYKRKYWLTK